MNILVECVIQENLLNIPEYLTWKRNSYKGVEIWAKNYY